MNRAHCERDAAKAEVAERDHCVHELEDALESERAKACREKKRADSVEKKLFNANAVVSKMDKLIGDKEGDIESLQNQLTVLRGMLSQSQSELKERQNELGQCRSELLKQTSRLDNASRRVSELEEQLEQSRLSQPSQQLCKKLNTLRVTAAEFWNRWLDVDESACKSATYTVKSLAQTLAIRQEAAYKTLFGAGIPSYDQLREDADLLNLMKQLGFGNDMHPDGYANPGVIAYYTLRYELGYAFEYYEI